ncbi:acyltransferase family protein [Pelagibius sp.]|uniref:acyltransferase family protein n=1 Tax=Pelagibius sp. TaxID=1931238 RepID=UPI0026116131|nr:acyltransferase family protein [Pelagibius sp.]
MTAPSSPNRRHDVDTLRAVVVLLLIVFHTARLFDAEPWHMKDLAAPFWAADFVIRALNIFQMPLLFLLAGMSAAWALERRSAGAFLRERAARLLVPLLVGIFVLVAPQVWLERISPQVPLRMSPVDFEGGFFAFLGPYLACCYPQANFSWHHLWFLLYLFVYCLPLAVVARSGALPGLAAWTTRAPWRLFLFGLVLVALETALRRSFPSTHNLIWDWANHAHYGFLVLFGWWLGRNPALEDALQRIRRLALVGALVLVALWFAALDTAFGGFGWVEISRALRHGLRIAAEWCLLLTALAYGRRLLAAPLPGLAAFVPIALPFYLFHQTVIVALGWLWLGWTGQPFIKALAIMAFATLLSLALAWLSAQSVLTRAAVGLPLRRRQRPGPAASSGPADRRPTT